jgi:hypothetical protein
MRYHLSPFHVRPQEHESLRFYYDSPCFVPFLDIYCHISLPVKMTADLDRNMTVA